jgi:hypothetical protein
MVATAPNASQSGVPFTAPTGNDFLDALARATSVAGSALDVFSSFKERQASVNSLKAQTVEPLKAAPPSGLADVMAAQNTRTALVAAGVVLAAVAVFVVAIR